MAAGKTTTARSVSSRFDVAARTVELEFNGRFSDVHTTTHTF